MGIKETIDITEQKTMNGLKDFQCATVERIDSLFRAGQKRVLVADEVGLGKTLIGRGVIAKTAKLRYEEGDKLFKVVYICSNQIIANQNLSKLNVFNVKIDKASDTRLSMQHLIINEKEVETKKSGDYIQLIPLTPDTSFRITTGGGSVSERALMYAVLKRIPKLMAYKNELEEILIYGASKAWDSWARDYYEDRVNKCNDNTGGKYPQNIIDSILKNENASDLIDKTIKYIEDLKYGRETSIKRRVIVEGLRTVFAQISVQKLEPDLVIMDEFQRFKFLIDEKYQNTDTGIIANRFFNNPHIRVLLLSATPYKLYSTIEEVEETSIDEHYAEFFQVIKFLNNDAGKMSNFQDIWKEYSVAIRDAKVGDTSILSIKADAEKALYDVACRTERISVMNTGDYIDDSSVHKSLDITRDDIMSYLEMGKALERINIGINLPIDYAKSSPYLMAFMRKYKIKEKVETYFKNNPDEVRKIKSDYLWLNRNQIDNYEEISSNNARLERLKEEVFKNNSELYLWIPPSKPYYRLGGVYENSQGFSKVLVFSSWEMVPRMIGGMISYEAERRTIGKIVSQRRNEYDANAKYFAESSSRFPAPRLRFNFSNNEPRGMSLFTMLYPSETLAEMYNPIEYMNEGKSLREISNSLSKKIDKLLETLSPYEVDTRRDERWYYMAPLLLDDREYVFNWINAVKGFDDDNDEDNVDRGNKGFLMHLNRLEELMKKGIGIQLGKMPSDLTRVLVNMTIGSFAICAYRANSGDGKLASQLARIFINRFNAPEATATVMLAYYDEGDDSHWKNVLRYCVDGGFQAMLDEYVHLVSEGVGFGQSENQSKRIHEVMVDALKIHSANYLVDTYESFSARCKGKNGSRTYLRSHFSVGFIKNETNDSKDVNRKDSIRNAFNSPMRPFVLATTSIGQEGLDFHQYCRKIMHWNLPSNPIDLEQREGRINRYKCLAIRQNIAQQFDNAYISSDVWTELFEMAAKEDKDEGQSDLVPYWCLGKNQSVKIDRIVPMYPYSKDISNYDRLIRILSLYRLTLGQARQEELLEYIFNEFKGSEQIKELFINLCPFSRTSDEWKKEMSSRKVVKIEKKKTARQEKIEKLKTDIAIIRIQLNQLLNQMNEYNDVTVLGMKVIHKKYGDGVIIGWSGNSIVVSFDSFTEKKLFKIPDAFNSGFLKASNDEILGKIASKNEIEEKIVKCNEQISEYEALLNELII